jgi:hypothetical protein
MIADVYFLEFFTKTPELFLNPKIVYGGILKYLQLLRLTPRLIKFIGQC